MAAGLAPREKSLARVPSGRGRGSLLSIIRESYTGAWQRGITVDNDLILTNPDVWACQTLIAGDFSKIGVLLVEKDNNGIWNETERAAFSPVLRKPNSFQTGIQFRECWALSKLSTGNTYVLLKRDRSDVVREMFVLDPTRVAPLVSDDGRVFYQLASDNLSGIEAQVTVPASEIIHDRWNCLYHPLVGLSPLYAAGLVATQSLNIQQDSTAFFGNRSMPGGILVAPGKIGDDTATRLKTDWDTNFGGANKGKVAVLGDGLKFEPMRINATDAQVVEQLKWSSERICATYHVPPYKIGLGSMPAGLNVQALNVEYYSQALQGLIESAEACLDEGLGLGIEGATKRLGVEFQVGDLLRMDALTQMEVIDKGKNTLTPNEGRKRINLPPVPGGNAVYRQQQDFSLEALQKRDAQADPFATAPAPAPPPPPEPEEDDTAERFIGALTVKFAEATLHG